MRVCEGVTIKGLPSSKCQVEKIQNNRFQEKKLKKFVISRRFYEKKGKIET